MLMLSVAAGDLHAQKTRRSFKERLVSFLDSSNVRNVDPEYIGLPERRWRIILNSNTDQMDLKLDAHTNFKTTDNNQLDLFFNMKVKPPVTSSLGLWAGYRGWGAGYGISLTGNNGINMSFNIATPSNGVNIRVRKFDFDKPYRRYTLFRNGQNITPELTIEEDEQLDDPMSVESFVFDGYWIFNSKRFSLSAAYDQSTRQKRSAGSLIAGAMFYYQKFDFSGRENAVLVDATGGFGKFKICQGSLGLGYTYNWVPARGWVINAVAMPVITLLDYAKVSKYHLEADFLPNGELSEDVIYMMHDTDMSDYGHVRLNMDARMVVSYWYRRWFFNIMGQLHSFKSTYDEAEMRMTEWDVKVSLGLLL